ncbi:hypothetical protein GCM10009804_64650 [Kribbella hippodromi]|uniref:Uncharacterized protein n=1 Tax=Kribbella hippodromi TaxID=434347 RepID=A0ABN2E7S8_9ACTN
MTPGMRGVKGPAEGLTPETLLRVLSAARRAAPEAGFPRVIQPPAELQLPVRADDAGAELQLPVKTDGTGGWRFR